MDFKQVFDAAPVPILIFQGGRIVYANAAGYEIIRFCGYPITPETLGEFQPLQMMDPDDLPEAARDLAGVWERGETVRNIPRTLRDAQGKRIAALVSAGPVTWEGAPAIEVSFVIVGLYPVERQVEAGPAARRQDGLGDARVGLFDGLTPRETRVALSVAEGWDSARIRKELGIRDSTLRGYIKSIYRKLGVHSRNELVRLVFGHR